MGKRRRDNGVGLKRLLYQAHWIRVRTLDGNSTKTKQFINILFFSILTHTIHFGKLSRTKKVNVNLCVLSLFQQMFRFSVVKLKSTSTSTLLTFGDNKPSRQLRHHGILMAG